jgi:RNA polymerase sigma-70 factor (ECF subfamily)
LTSRTNEEWLKALRGSEQSQAIADLRALLLRGLQIALSDRVRNQEEILEDFVQEALLKILDKLDTFRGESRFTTWAQKIAVNVALSELRRRHWKNISLQEIIEPYEDVSFAKVMLNPGTSPEEKATQNDILQIIYRLIQEELTEKQRRAIMAVMGGGMPLEEVARRMGTNRNALYKLIHDARLKMRNALLASTGLSADEVLAMFGEG